MAELIDGPSFDATQHPHRRLNPLTGEYVLVSPHRMKRPWQGQTEQPETTVLPPYDPKCYLCPGNERSGGQVNDAFDSTFIFENDFAAVLPDAPAAPVATHPLFQTEPVLGGCDVLIFHPRHDLTLPLLSQKDIERIVEEWVQIYLRRGKQDGIKYIQIFENKGSMMGCSNPHGHNQAWSLSAIPTIPATELTSLRKYSISEVAASDAPRGPEGRPCLLCEYAHAELQVAHDQGRVVVKNEHWVAVVPWWATWPFEILLLPYKRHIPSIRHLDAAEKSAFADILKKITTRYDNLFQCSFAYSMGIHQMPVPDDTEEVAHLHLHFNPPLLRSATVRKFLVGYELMAEAQRDLTSEQAAIRLRACSEEHYLKDKVEENVKN